MYDFTLHKGKCAKIPQESHPAGFQIASTLIDIFNRSIQQNAKLTI